MCFYYEKPISFAICVKSAELDDNEITCDSSLYAKLKDVATVGRTSQQIYLVCHLSRTKSAENTNQFYPSGITNFQ